MRIHVPESAQGNPSKYVAETYAIDIVGAAMNLSRHVYQSSRLTLREFEAARARTAEINGCMLCQNFRAVRDLPGLMDSIGGSAEHSVAARGPAPDEAFYQGIGDWRSSSLYSVRERLAIEFAERVGTAPKEIARDEAFWSRAKASFTDDEIVDLSYCLASWIGLGRVAHVLGIDTVCTIHDPGQIEETSPALAQI